MKRLIKTESPIYILFCVLCFQRQPIFTAAGVSCREAVVKSLPLLHHSADYILVSFGIIEHILVALKMKYRLNGC